MCAAKFDVDNRWYRGLVKDVDDTNSTVTIFFVDWGNAEQCSTRNIRTLESHFLQVPVMAFPFSLHKAIPINNTHHWADEICDIDIESKEGTLRVRPSNKKDSRAWPIDICSLELSDVSLEFVFLKVNYLFIKNNIL
jgi:hypothetical protein